MGNNPHTDGRSPSRFGKNELELLRKMFEDAPVALGVLEGPDHRIQYMNRNLRELYGNRPVSLGLPIIEFWTDLEKSYMKGMDRLNMMDQVYTSGEPFIANEVKAYIDRKYSGSVEKGYFTFVYQPLSEPDGEVYGIVITGYEVTERVKARRESTRHEQRLEFALEGGQVGYWEVDTRNMEIVSVSEQWKQHFGRPGDHRWTMDDFFGVLHPENRSRVREELNRAIENSGRYETEYCVRWPDGSLHWLLARGQCLRGEDGSTSCLVGLTIDITRQKESERELKEAIRLRDDFLSIAAHELRTPVTGIKARGELFERRLRDAGNLDWADNAQTINKHIDQLSSLTTKLLDISRMQQGQLKLEKELFSIGELIKEKVDTLSHISHHKIEVQGEVQKPVYADRFRIGQVLTNLLENAAKYSPDADRIVVRYREESGKIIVSVVDFGMGIPKEDQQRVFERFFKGTDGQRRTYPGFGIGLYIARQIVERHGGGIWVEDNPEGGSMFSFSLPVAGRQQSGQ